MERITKTDFRRFIECPGEFWLSRNRKDLLARDYDREARFRSRLGYEVQKLAEEWLTARGDGEYEFQRVVETADCFARLDAYLPAADGAWIVEIKSSSNKRRAEGSTKAERLKLINDIGFQVLVAREAGERVSRALLVTVNPDFVYDGDYAGFFVIEDVLDEIQTALPEIEDGRRRAIGMLNRPPVIDFERLCSKKLECEFVRFLKDDIPARNVGQIPRISNSKIKSFADSGIFSLSAITSTKGLTKTQKRYVETAKSPVPIVQKDELRQFLDRIRYPIYFLDYESVAFPVPRVQGMRPWCQYTFQYSLHIIDGPGSDPEHREFVSDGTGIAPLELAGSLSRDLGPIGTVLVWNKSFEMGRNSEMGSMFPEFRRFLEDLNSRIVDLKDVFDDGLYRHPEIVDHSIKSVLPVMVPGPGYQELDIGDGGTASAAWFEDVLNGHGRTKEATIDALREYCGFDTIAMVRIFRFLASEAGR